MKKRELPWYKREPGEHLAAAADLDLEQEGALLRMRDWFWLNGPLPADSREVAKLLRAPRRAALFAALLDRFFELTHAGWIDPALEEQRTSAQDKRARLSQSGAAGAAARWGGDGMANAKANAMANATDEKWQMPLYARSKISNREEGTEEVGSSTPRARAARLAAGGES